MVTYHHNERAIDAGDQSSAKLVINNCGPDIELEHISESPLPPPPIPPSRPSLSKTPTKANQIRTKITSTMKDGEIGSQFESHGERIEHRMPSVSTIRKRFWELRSDLGPKYWTQVLSVSPVFTGYYWLISFKIMCQPKKCIWTWNCKPASPTSPLVSTKWTNTTLNKFISSISISERSWNCWFHSRSSYSIPDYEQLQFIEQRRITGS